MPASRISRCVRSRSYSDAPEARPLRVEVEEEVGRAGVAVPRLPDRSGIEEGARAAQLDFRAGRGEAAFELVARLHDAQRDVAVPDEDERRVRELERRQGAFVAEDVLPDRVARRAVVERDSVCGSGRLQPVEELLRLRLEHIARPARGDRRLAAELF